MYLLRNLSRSPESHTTRVSRKGRWTGFILDTGTRVRRKGPRYTEIDEATLKANLEEIIWGVEDGYIEVLTSDEKPIACEALKLFHEAKSHQILEHSSPSKPEAQPVESVQEKISNDPDNRPKESSTESHASAKPVQVFSKKKHLGA